jgi:CrcB protein
MTRRSDAVRVGWAWWCVRLDGSGCDRTTGDQEYFPWATLSINLAGAFALGLFLTLALGHLSVAVITPISVGVLGGFTTFSAFAWEGFTHARSGRVGVASVYVLVSVVGGLIAAAGGYAAGQALR